MNANARTSMHAAEINKVDPPVEQAYKYIVNRILSGEFTAGTRIPTESVAEALGISRTPVRDALRSLEGSGVVTIFANRGAAIAKYSRSEVIQLIEMRSVLEGLAARFAVQNIDAAEIEELLHLKSQMEWKAGMLSEWIAAHDAFHNYLTSLCQRPLLTKEAERLRFMLLPYYRKYYSQSNEMEIFGLEHEKLLNAIELRDASLLEQIVREHTTANVQRIADLA